MYYGNMKFLDKDYNFIQWNITSNCNMDCYYCDFHDNNKQILNKNIIIQWIKNTYTNGTVSLFGGEPMITPFIYDIINILSEQFNIEINTNLKKDIELDKIKYIDKLNFNITLHYPQMTKEEMFIKLDKLKIISDKIKVKVMYDSKYANECISIYNSIKKYMNVTLNMINYDGQEHIKEQNNIISEQYSHDIKYLMELSRKNINPFYNCNCTAGKQSIFIDYNGDVYPCISFKINNLKHIGNIFMKNVKNKQKTCLVQGTCHDFFALKDTYDKKL